ncbi:MAG: EF-hand domain-containing protein [Pseudomonadota bacterium]|nr:EF-hand domain-containing protein [Pseudomonadota bacterium]
MRFAGTMVVLLVLLAPVVQAQDSRQKYLQQFDSNGDGRVSEAEYLNYMSRSFRRMDADGNGVLTPDELPGGRGRAVSLSSFQGNLRQQFHKLDRNRDGYLNARELTAPPG